MFFVYSAGSLVFSVAPTPPPGLDLVGGVLSGVPLEPDPAIAVTVTATAVGGPWDGEIRQSVLEAEVHPGNAAPVGGDAGLVFRVTAWQPPPNLAPQGASQSLVYLVTPGQPSDTVAPTIVSTSPADNATGVAVDAVITITFSEAVVFGSGAITLRSGGADVETFNVQTDVGTGAGQVSISGSVLTIRPSANLTAGTAYAIRIASTAITDLASNAFAGIADDTTLNFTTAAASVVRRALVSASAAANTGMRSAANVTLPSTGYTVAFWWKRNGTNTSKTLFASQTGQDQIFSTTTAGRLAARYGNSSDAGGISTQTIADNTWAHVCVQMGLSISGSNDALISVNGETFVARNSTTGASESASGGVLYVLCDDANGGPSDDGFAGRVFDFCIVSGLHTPAEMNYNAGSWKDLDASLLGSVILRLDGQTAGSPGADSSGNGHSFTIENSGIVLDDSDLPSGANP